MTQNKTKHPHLEKLKKHHQELLQIGKGQKIAVILHIVVILLYIAAGICLGVLQWGAWGNVPIWLIYAAEIIICGSLLYRAERRLLEHHREAMHKLPDEVTGQKDTDEGKR